MYIDETTEKENMILAMNPSKLKEGKTKEKYWNLRNSLEDADDD